MKSHFRRPIHEGTIIQKIHPAEIKDEQSHKPANTKGTGQDKRETGEANSPDSGENLQIDRPKEFT